MVWSKGGGRERWTRGFARAGVGCIAAIIGVLAFFALSGVDVYLSSAFFSAAVLEVVVLLLGIFYIQEAVRSRKVHKERSVYLFIGLFLFFLGVFPILVFFNLLTFFPVRFEIDVSPFLLAVLLFFSGAFLVIDPLFLSKSEQLL